MNDFQFKIIVRLLFLIANLTINIFQRVSSFAGVTLSSENLLQESKKELRIMRDDYLKSLK